MFHSRSIRLAAIAAFGVFLALCGTARGVLPPGALEDLKAGAKEALEVRVLEAQVPPGHGERYEVLYHMEVLSALRSASRVQPGETIVVRAYALTKEALDRGVVGPKAPTLLTPGWIGIAYLNPDPEASGPEARRKFVIAAHGHSFELLPPAPPSLRYTR